MSLLGDVLLEALVKAEPGSDFNALFHKHGPIEASELEMLAQRARDSNVRIRRNATTLLGLGRGNDRDLLLRVLARETMDPAVFVLATSALADGAALAKTRPSLVATALRDPDPKVTGAAIALAWRAGLPDSSDQLRANLADPRVDVRNAALEVLAESGPGPLVPQIRALLASPNAHRYLNLTAIYQALLQADDPTIAEVLAASLVDAGVSARVSLTTAFMHVASRAAWTRGFLVAQVHGTGAWRWAALDLLKDDPDAPIAELVPVCRDYLAMEIATGKPEGTLWLRDGVTSSVAFFSKLADRPFHDLRDTLAFASTLA